MQSRPESHRIHGAAIYGNIYHQYTPNVSIYTIHGSYGIQVNFSEKLLDAAPEINAGTSVLLKEVTRRKKDHRLGEAMAWCFSYLKNICMPIGDHPPIKLATSKEVLS